MNRLFLMVICTMFAYFGTAQNAQNKTSNTPAPATTNATATATASSDTDTSGGFAIAKIPEQVYTGVAFTPELSIKDGNKMLVRNIDYTLTYQNNVNVGTSTISILGKGNYQGTTTVTFQITPKSINAVAVNPIADQTYRSTPITPEVSIRDGNRPLVKDVDYTLSYVNNVNVGGATVTITGKGNYKDAKTLNFRINAKSFGGGAGAGTRSATGAGSATGANQGSATKGAATSQSTGAAATTTTTATTATTSQSTTGSATKNTATK